MKASPPKDDSPYAAMTTAIPIAARPNAGSAKVISRGLEHPSAGEGEALQQQSAAGEGSPDMVFEFDDQELLYLSADEAAQRSGAYRRAVHVPFLESTAAAGKKLTVAEEVSAVIASFKATTAAPRVDAGALAAELRRLGYSAALAYPPRVERSDGAVKMAGETEVNWGSVSPYLLVRAQGGDEEIVVEPELQAFFRLPPSLTTTHYARKLERLPAVFVGPRVRLLALAAEMAVALALNFTSQGLEVSPWRRRRVILARWLQPTAAPAAEPVALEAAPAAPAPAPASPVSIPAPAPAAEEDVLPKALSVASSLDTESLASISPDSVLRTPVVRGLGEKGTKGRLANSSGMRPVVVVHGFEVAGSFSF